jgi:hypothetical protein
MTSGGFRAPTSFSAIHFSLDDSPEIWASQRRAVECDLTPPPAHVRDRDLAQSMALYAGPGQPGALREHEEGKGPCEEPASIFLSIAKKDRGTFMARNWLGFGLEEGVRGA